MTLTVADRQQIADIVVDVTTPMFEHVIDVLGQRIDKLDSRMDSLDGRMDKLDSRMDKLENRMSKLEVRACTLESELRDFKAEVRTKFVTLEEKIDSLAVSHAYRFENVEEDIQLIYKLVNKLEHGNADEQQFAEQTIIRHLPAIYKAIVLVAKKENITLPKLPL